jgi:Holliday junction DNA helicase RuvA
LRGEVVLIEPEGPLVLNVNDVGYEVLVPSRTAAALAIGSTTELFVHTHVRDDAIVLFGFESPDERRTFELLLATPGVGPTTSLGALSTMTPDALADAIVREDVDLLATIPGIGKKTAARLVLELTSKLPHLTPAAAASSNVSADLSAALRQLGYSSSEIRDAMKDLELPDDDEGALRMVLRQLGRR